MGVAFFKAKEEQGIILEILVFIPFYLKYTTVDFILLLVSFIFLKCKLI